MTTPLLLEFQFSDIWPYLIPFLSSVLAYIVGSLTARNNRAAAETTEQKKAREKAERDQAAEVAALRVETNALRTALEERKRTADAERMQDKLKFEADLSAVTNILKEFTEAQRLLTGVATNVANHEKRLDRHDTEFDNYNAALDTIRDHLNRLLLSAPRHGT